MATKRPLPGVDSSTGRLTLAILGAVAAFENDIRRERQADGIAKAKAGGAYKGRKPQIDPARIRALSEAGKRPSEIVAELKVSRASVWRALRPANQETQEPSLA